MASHGNKTKSRGNDIIYKYLHTMNSEVQHQNVHTRATDLSAPESRRQVNDRFPSQTAEVEFASRCRVHEQTVTTNKQTTLSTLCNDYDQQKAIC